MKKILLIEDNPDMRENTEEILELANYQVITAENGKVGVEYAKAEKPDLIICDIMMPELDGYGVLYMLSKNPDTASIPFIFLTAKAEKSDFRKGMNMGADDYLTKPFEEMELLSAVESRLNRSETFKSKFDGNIEGLNNFINEAKGLEELKALSSDRKSRTYKKKETIYHEGDYPNNLYFINTGKIKTFKINDDGKEYITGLHKAGDFLGFMAMLEETDHNESASVLEEAEVNIIPREDFIQLIHSNKDVASQFIKMLANNILEKEKQLLDLAYNTVRKRVADALVRLMDKYRAESHDEDFTMAVSRDDLASIVGTATESVIRSLADLKEDGYIEIKASKITIKKPKELRNLRY